MPVTIENNTITLPEQYHTRHLTLDDVDAVIALINRTNSKKGYASNGGPDELRADWQEPYFDLEASSLAIEDQEGAIVAQAILWDVADQPVRPFASWSLAHDLYGTDVEAYVLDWIETIAKRTLEKCKPEYKVTLQTNALGSYDRRIDALINAGYRHARNFYRMSIEMDTAPLTANIPNGFTIRGMQYPDEIRAMAQAVELGFQDHWGFVQEPLDKAVEFWTHYLETDNLFDPDLYFLAIDDATGAIAGLVLCRMEQVGKPETAYVEELAVLPDYRRQGLALNMLHHAFGELYQRGRRQVALHVDADSLTGATRLYTKAGMAPVETWMNFQKVLRNGVDISTTSVE